MDADFPFGHDAVFRVDRVEGAFPVGSVELRASIKDLPEANVATLSVEFRCRECQQALGATLDTCDFACNDPDGCETLDNVRQCFGAGINCRRVTAGMLGSIC